MVDEVQALEVAPFVSVGGLRFGMNLAQVTRVLGAADQEEVDPIMEETRVRWGSLTCKFKPKSLQSVWFAGRGNVTFATIDLFRDEHVLARLSAMDSESEDAGDYANFPKLGVCIGGFGKRRIKEGRVVIVYSKKLASYMHKFIRV